MHCDQGSLKAERTRIFDYAYAIPGWSGKGNFDRLTRRTPVTTLLAIFSKNYYVFLPDTNECT